MSRKIFISNIDSPLGYHIAQQFRQDHLSTTPDNCLVGTGSLPLQHPWIHASIDVPSYPFSSSNILSWPAGLPSTATSSF